MAFRAFLIPDPQNYSFDDISDVPSATLLSAQNPPLIAER